MYARARRRADDRRVALELPPAAPARAAARRCSRSSAARPSWSSAEPVNGARRWISFGPAVFQPSELAKLALAIWAAAYLAQAQPRRARCRSWRGRSALSLGVFCVLILLEPDLGTAIALLVMARRRAGRRGHAGPRRSGRRRDRSRVVGLSRSGASRTGARGSSASWTRGRRAGRRLPDRAGDDRPRLGRLLRRRASARACRRSTTCPRRTRT